MYVRIFSFYFVNKYLPNRADKVASISLRTLSVIIGHFESSDISKISKPKVLITVKCGVSILVKHQ